MRKGPYIFWSIFVAAAIFRVVGTFSLERPDVGPCIKNIVSGSGIVDSDPEMKESGQVLVVMARSLVVASTSISCKSGFLLRLKTKQYPRFRYGDEVSFKGKLLKPVNFSNKNDPGRAFDYEGYLAKSDIYYEMKSAQVSSGVDHFNIEDNKEDEKVEIGLVKQIIGRITGTLYSSKRNFVKNLNKILGEPHAALASGLVVGEKAALGNDLLDDFRTVGLIHIVVLSGYNITIVGDAIRRMLILLPRMWGISIGGIGIALFGILVGGGATVVRSCFMAGIALSASVIRRDYDVTRALVFAGLVMIIQSPMILLHDPSFQLSFLATLGLILLAGPLESKLKFIPEKFGIRGVVAATLATQIFVSPYILYMMGNLSIIGIVVNISVLPFIPITMLFVFLTGSIGMISISVAQIFGWVTHMLLSYELFLVQTFAKIPFAAIHLPAFSRWWVVGFYVVFFLVYWGRSQILPRLFSIVSQFRFEKKSSM